MGLELLFLGTGTSTGVPMVGCQCEVCQAPGPRDWRSRPSVLIQYPAGENAPATTGQGEPQTPLTRSILVDTTPELRQQALRHRLDRLDGVMITHAHMDHVVGLDDLRRFNAVMQAPLDLYGEASVLERLAEMFRHIFQPEKNVNNSYVASLIPTPVHVEQAFDLLGATWTPLRLMHGRLPVLGFRVDWQGQALAYCTDVSTIPPETYPYLEDLDVLVLDALRFRHHPTHMTVDQALNVVDHVQPRQAYFTHITHDIRHDELDAQLPDGVNLAYDDLRVEVGGRSTPPNPAGAERDGQAFAND
jgi:phosphoribosyl 1,2-cyclic phosphate phosphodiesterase